MPLALIWTARGLHAGEVVRALKLRIIRESIESPWSRHPLNSGHLSRGPSGDWRRPTLDAVRPVGNLAMPR